MINSNTTIYNSLCVGFDCLASEAYGFDTIRLKENNLQLHFDDTSSSSGFPANDWRLVANDRANGGLSYLAFEDVTAGRKVFRVDAGARANALVVDPQGDVGIGTGTPATDIEVVVGNTPTLRLRQDGSAGFTPQTWDIAGNEAGFFIRDATGGSQLPFRILPGANSSSLVIDGDNDVGIGAGTNPQAPLHVERSDGKAKILVEENSGTTAARGMLEMKNNGTLFMSFYDTSQGADTVPGAKWNFQNQARSFRITTPPGGPGQIEFVLDQNGNLTINGSLTQNSDKNKKMAIKPVDAGSILDKVAALPVSTWTYKHDAEDGIRHIGPMAQDFYALFGTGSSETGISSIDTSGVALAAIQALIERVEQQSAEIEGLRAELMQR